MTERANSVKRLTSSPINKTHIVMRTKTLAISLIMITISLNVLAQESNKVERNSIRSGNRLYENGNYIDAEIDYRRALAADSTSSVASYNLGNSLYRQQKGEEAIAEYKKAAETNPDPKKSAEAWYNLGNTFMQQENYAESIEAYKNALRKEPKDDDARYNLRMAQLMMQQQEQQQQDQQDDNKDENEDKQDQQQQQQQDSQQNDKEDKKDEQQQQQQQQDSKMSKENAEQILKALQQDERDTQKRVQQEMMERQESIKTDKEW